jgi:hypothetical protein
MSRKLSRSVSWAKRHDLILRGARQLAHRAIAIIARDNPVEGSPGQKIHDLRE